MNLKNTVITPPTSRREWAELFLDIARLGLCFYLLLHPFGISFREIGGSTATVGLALYYILDWRGSVLARFPLRAVFAAFLALILFKTLHSMHPSLSRYALTSSLHATLFLGLAALETARTWRHISWMVGCMAAMACAQGVAGVYQYVFNHAFNPSDVGFLQTHRLTGTMHTPRVGNLMSLATPAILALPALLPARWPMSRRIVTSLLVAAPALFLLVFSHTRSGWLGFVLVITVFGVLRFGPRTLLGVAALVVFFLLANGLGRFDPAVIAADQRWTIWGAAIEVFKAYPVFGAGLNTYHAAYTSLGIEFPFTAMPHPHNIYLQFLADTGIVGFTVAVAFLFGTLAYMLPPLWRRRGRYTPHGLIALAMVSAYAGYLLTAATAHEFFRTWWLGLAMSVQGLGLACARLLREEDGTP
jgi:O-antigen ligase